jgi:hypothetical protein
MKFDLIVNANLDLVESHNRFMVLAEKFWQDNDLQGLDDQVKFDKLVESYVTSLEKDYKIFPSVGDLYILIVKRLKGGLSHQIFRTFLQKVLSDEILSPEDLIDLYTLKRQEDAEEQEEATDFLHALQIWTRSQHSLPSGRAQMALRTIWRRVYLSDK